MNMLAKNHSTKHLILIRKELDVLQGNFAEKSQQFQKIYIKKFAPSSSPDLFEAGAVSAAAGMERQ